MYVKFEKLLQGYSSVQDQEGVCPCGEYDTTLLYLSHKKLWVMLTMVSILGVCICYTGLHKIYIFNFIIQLLI